MKIQVSGVGAISAAGNNITETLSTIYASQINITEKPQFFTDLLMTFPTFQIGHLPIQNNLLQFFKPTRTVTMALIALNEALANAKLQVSELKKLRVGVSIGTIVGAMLNNGDHTDTYNKIRSPSKTDLESFMNNNPALYISKTLGLNGPVTTVINACAAGTDAIGIAKMWLQEDLCDVVIAGGAEELSRVSYYGFTSLKLCSSSPCKPFSKLRDGLNLGEGAGILILENEKNAKKRNAPCYATVAGYSTMSDAYHPTAPHPEGRGLKKAIALALKDSSLTPKDISFIKTHGTATFDNDKVEGPTLASIFGNKINIFTPKAYIGHTLGAAGAIETILAIELLNKNMLPKTPYPYEYDENCVLVPPQENTSISGEYALATSLAFGGTNSVLIIKRGTQK